MATSEGGAHKPHHNSSMFQSAQVYVKLPGNPAKKSGGLAHIAITGNIRWIYATDSTPVPEYFIDFRSGHCLQLERVERKDGKEPEWEDVEKIACLVDEQEGRALKVCGKMNRCGLPGIPHRIELVIIPDKNNTDVLIEWQAMVQARVTPWELLKKQMLNGMGNSRNVLNLATVANKFKELKVDNHFSNFVRKTQDSSEKSQKIPEHAERVIHTARGPINVLKELSECIGTVSKCVALSHQHLEAVANMASNISDVCECITVVSAVFQVVALGAKVGLLMSEAHRGKRKYPDIAQWLVRLYCELSKCMEVILEGPDRIPELSLDSVFRTQESIFSAMCRTEEELMRRYLSRVYNADSLKDIEAQAKQLEKDLIPILNMREILRLDKRLERVESQNHVRKQVMPEIKELQTLPTLSPYFSGRKKEMENVLKRVWKNPVDGFRCGRNS